jgi:hypothetical protein
MTARIDTFYLPVVDDNVFLARSNPELVYQTVVELLLKTKLNVLLCFIDEGRVVPGINPHAIGCIRGVEVSLNAFYTLPLNEDEHTTACWTEVARDVV